MSRTKSLNTSESSGKLAIRTFGGLSVFYQGSPIPITWKSQKARLLFCYLIITCDQWVHRDKFIEMLWPGCTGSAGANNFKTTLSRIRMSFTGPTAINPVLTQGDAVRINMLDIDADISGFRHHAVTGIKLMSRGEAMTARECLEAAQDLYSGEFLPEEPYNHTINTARNELAELHCSVLRCLGKIYHQEGNHDALEAFLFLRNNMVINPA